MGVGVGSVVVEELFEEDELVGDGDGLGVGEGEGSGVGVGLLVIGDGLGVCALNGDGLGVGSLLVATVPRTFSSLGLLCERFIFRAIR